jgi:hypothetical protein
MRLLRTRRLEFALLLVVLLPLQGLAAASSCGTVDAAAMTAQQHCAHGDGAIVHHHCSTCCSVAATAVAPLPWVAPRFANLKTFRPVLGSPPAGILDRLDRPPRSTPA